MGQNSTPIKTQNRVLPLIAGILIQMCCGTAYIWGVFQSYLIITNSTPNALFNWSPTYGTLAYALLLSMLTVGSVTGGKSQQSGKVQPKTIIVIGGLVMGVGFLLAQFTTNSTPWLLWLSYGIMGGIGMGMVYTTTIAVCQKWYPDHRGMVTGIIVSALGAGTVIFTQLSEIVIPSLGVLKTFGLLGVVFIVICTLGSFFIKNPPEDFKPAGWNPPTPKDGQNSKNFLPIEALKTPQLYLTAAALLFATTAGSMVIPMAKVFGLSNGLAESVAAAGVLIIGACNSLGRFIWGLVSDKFGRKNTLIVLLIITAVSIIALSFVPKALILFMFAVVGFTYGGFLGVFPSLTADFYGTKYVATIYGIVLSGFGIGAVASAFIVGELSKIKAFSTAFAIAAVAAAISFVIVLTLKAPKEKVN
ncbi:L-lactate MFS transporter [Acetivibrio clariflavus]|uniref:Sugar phosphate permease n=1 Tax=Acetivibrio clariflavus (strain DSM 19732 / NBRC 101661 / EBR45) TaxID=720554 RepID=G8LWY0_ACECE|nr:OFA family MFS transporter [Acetivibrio clariflavus]AEV67632.1 sugar phosphate permease [Acetivibrio clariflavus DSM 19732]